MGQSGDYSDEQIDWLVRRHLEEQAEEIDTSRLLARLDTSLASGSKPRPVARPPANHRLRRIGLAWGAAAVVVVLAVAGSLRLWPESVHAASLLRESLEVHRLPVDRCYLIQRQREGDQSSVSAVERVDRLWTRGRQFYWESSTDRYRWTWGRNEEGSVWLTYGRRHGIKLEPEELPPWLATLCEVLSMEMETLLGDILQGYELTTESSDSPQTVIIHARGQRGRSHRWLKEATLEIDRETRVLRRATVTRLLRDGRTVTLTFTLVSSEAQPAGRYELDGHLEKPFHVFTRDYRPHQRRQILDRLFGRQSFAASANRDTGSLDVDQEP